MHTPTFGMATMNCFSFIPYNIMRVYLEISAQLPFCARVSTATLSGDFAVRVHGQLIFFNLCMPFFLNFHTIKIDLVTNIENNRLFVK